MARCAISLGGLSALAEISTTLSMMLPGMPAEELPVTPDIFLFPAASVSAVLVQVGCASAASNEDANSVPLATLGPTRVLGAVAFGVTARGRVSAGFGAVGALGVASGWLGDPGWAGAA